MLRRHPGRVEHGVKLGHVQPEDGHAEREGDGREEIRVLRRSVEQRWVLEDRKAPGPARHEVEPLPNTVSDQAPDRRSLPWRAEFCGGKHLHDDEVHKVDT